MVDAPERTGVRLGSSSGVPEVGARVVFFLSLGVVVVPENKRLRALTSMLAMASGEPTTFSAYQAATSFLQYLKPFVADADGTYFYGLYEPYSRGADGQQPNPADIVTMTPAIRE